MQKHGTVFYITECVENNEMKDRFPTWNDNYVQNDVK